MKKQISVAIGIPAHNEEGTIGPLLSQILLQKIGSGFMLERVVVVCDGCTDNTEKVVKEYSQRDKRISSFNDGRRRGLSKRLTQLFQSTKQEILITLDADTYLASDRTLHELLQPFQDPIVALVGGNDTPAPPTNLIQRIGAAWVEAWYEMRHTIRQGDTVHNHKGCVSAGRTSFLRTVSIPSSVHSSDDFVYFSAKKRQVHFRFAEKAVVYYTIPNNMKEYFIQSIRFLDLKKEIISYFGDWVLEHYRVPVRNKIIGLAKVLLRHPVNLTLALTLQVYMRLRRNKFAEKYRGVSWTVIQSSKK